MQTAWPDIPYAAWSDSCAALHLWCQIVGKYKLARSPWQNHSWHATFQVDGAGLTTGLVPDAGGIEARFDLQQHRLDLRRADGATRSLPLEPMSIADFHRRFRSALGELAADARFHGRPNELPHATPFARDQAPRPYDAEAVSRFHRALVAVAGVFQRFRTGFIGKASPVHLFWGSFDLAVTRFSGRTAPLHPGGVPNLPDAVAREAYSDEVCSAGFWPGGAGFDDAAFYCYAYPEPDGFAEARVTPEEAFYHPGLREFILPYAAVRAASDPGATLLGFLQTSYAAAADLGGWVRDRLEAPIGTSGVPRPLI